MRRQPGLDLVQIPFVGTTAGAGIDNWNYRDNTGAEWSGNTAATTYGPQVGFLVPLTDSVMLDTRISYKHFNFNGEAVTSDNVSKDRNEVAMSMGIMVKL